MRIKDRPTIYLYSITICMGSLVFGYALTSYSHLISRLSSYNPQHHQYSYTSMLALASSILPLSAIFGAAIYRCLVDSFGFLNTFHYLDYATIIACAISITTLSLPIQLFSRVLLGLVVGVNTVIIPTYLTSCLPGSMGGPAGTLNQLFITIGIFLGCCVGFMVIDSQGQLSWRILLALPILPSLIRLYTTLHIFPYQTVQHMLQIQDDLTLRQYLYNFFQDITLQQFKQMKTLPSQQHNAELANAFDDIGQPFRRRFNMACFIVIFNQLSGGSAMWALAIEIFPLVVGWEPNNILWSLCLLTLLQVGVTFIAGQLLERYGRRSFMLEGQRVIILSLILATLVTAYAPDMKEILYVVIFLQMVGFSLSFGPCSFLIGTQTLYDVTYPSMILWIFTFLWGVAIVSIVDIFGFATLFLFELICSFIGLFYIAGYLVQTQGRSRKQVYAEYRKDCFPIGLHWNKFLTKRNTVKQQKTEIEAQLLPTV